MISIKWVAYARQRTIPSDFKRATVTSGGCALRTKRTGGGALQQLFSNDVAGGAGGVFF